MEAAVDLFEEHGTSVTANSIAKRAVVSRRTILRYVDSKEELAFVQPLLWIDVFDEAVASEVAAFVTDGDASQPTLASRIYAGAAAVAAHIDADPDPVRRAFLLSIEHPDLARGFQAVSGRWTDRVSQEALVGVDPSSADARLRSRVIGSATMGMIDAITREWILAVGDESMVGLIDKGWHYLEPLLNEPA